MNEKDLDIPSQREMLANYRCTEIKQNILSKYDKTIKDLNSEAAKKDISNFKERCANINNAMLNDYDEVAKNYDDKIYENIRKQLEESISQKLFACFLNQTKRLIPMIQKFMRLDLANQLKKSESDNYMEFADRIGTKYIKMLINKLEDKKFSPNWNITEQEFANIFDEIIENQKEKCLKEKRTEVIKTLKKEYLDAFETSIEKNKNEDLNENKKNTVNDDTINDENQFWIEFNTLCSNYFFLNQEGISRPMSKGCGALGVNSCAWEGWLAAPVCWLLAPMELAFAPDLKGFFPKPKTSFISFASRPGVFEGILKPVAITVTLILSPMDSSKDAPKIMFTSGCAAS